MFWSTILLRMMLMFMMLIGYQGRHFEQFHQQCPEPFKSEYCFNNGECFTFGEPGDGSIAVCQCVPGFFGARCNQKDISRSYTSESTSVTEPTEKAEPESYIGVAAIVLFLVLIMVIWGILAYTTSIVSRMSRNLLP